jgi:hypothetical protein|tara:strand:- start:87 stop:302 length:216 start_codon:yes stop_codon:yes gene_type:complete
MTQQIIKFMIRQDGTVTEEVIGAVGNECENLTRNIEEKLGVVQRVEHKPEYYQAVSVEETIQEFTHDSEGC